MPVVVKSTSSTETETVNRIIRYRLYPGDAETGDRLRGTAGAARFIWNLFLDLCEWRWETWKANPVGPKPSVSFFTLGKLFTQIRKGQPEAWLASALKQIRPDIDDYTWQQAYESKSVKQVFKDLERAYKAYFNPARPEAGKPILKGKYGTTPPFGIPCDVRIQDGLLHVTKVGKLRLKDHPGHRIRLGARLEDMPTISDGLSPTRKLRRAHLNPVHWWGCVAVLVLLLYTLYHTPVGVQALSALTTGAAQTAISATVPLVVQIGDRQHNLQVPPGTVADALAWSRIAVGPLDLVDPGLETPVDADLYIRIVIRERSVSEALVPVPYEVVWEGDPALPIDHQALRAPGRAGSMVQRNLHEHHDGQAMTNLQRTESWLTEAPQPRRIAYGRMIVRRVYESPAGNSVDYWRKVRMWTTSYSAARAGTPTDAPWYGYTFSGEPMRNGVVAANLDVLPLGTRVFVEGYGEGEVLDTGGGLGPRDLDLGYADEDYRSWARWSDVYLLWPPPPAGEIVWVLPPIQADR